MAHEKERALLFSFLKKNENVTIPDYDSNKHLMIDSFLASLPEEKEEKKHKHDSPSKVRYDELKLLQDRQRFVITHYCNAIGCRRCPLKEYDENDKETCESTILQNKIMDLEFNPLNH